MFHKQKEVSQLSSGLQIFKFTLNKKIACSNFGSGCKHNCWSFSVTASYEGCRYCTTALLSLWLSLPPIPCHVHILLPAACCHLTWPHIRQRANKQGFWDHRSLGTVQPAGVRNYLQSVCKSPGCSCSVDKPLFARRCQGSLLFLWQGKHWLQQGVPWKIQMWRGSKLIARLLIKITGRDIALQCKEVDKYDLSVNFSTLLEA